MLNLMKLNNNLGAIRMDGSEFFDVQELFLNFYTMFEQYF